jgi:poly(A) polymerase
MIDPKMRIQPPWLSEPSLKLLFEVLGHPTLPIRFVGGCVRDALLNKPVVDIDIAVPYAPHITLERLQKAHIHAIPTGLEFGTITAIVGHKPYEITSLRQDIETNGRHATKVIYTNSFEEDAERRDFTMNALYMDLEGSIEDYVGGIEDLKKGILRFVGDPITRMQEDILRMLRYFRFFVYYCKTDPDQHILDACIQMKDQLSNLSGERIHKEFKLILKSPNPYKILKIMMDHGLIAVLFPYINTVDTLYKLIELETFYQSEPQFLVRLATLLKKSQYVKTCYQRIKLSRHDSHRLQSLLKTAEHFQQEPSLSTLLMAQEKIGLADFAQNTLLLIMSLTEDNDTYKKAKSLYSELPLTFPPFPLKGQDFMTLGLQGKDIGLYSDLVKIWWMNHKGLPSKEDCLAHLKEVLKT